MVQNSGYCEDLPKMITVHLKIVGFISDVDPGIREYSTSRESLKFVHFVGQLDVD